MSKQLEELLKQVFALVLKVNTSTNHKAAFDTQPVFNTDQIWYGVWNSSHSYMTNQGCAFKDNESQCIKRMTEFKEELETILKQRG